MKPQQVAAFSGEGQAAADQPVGDNSKGYRYRSESRLPFRALAPGTYRLACRPDCRALSGRYRLPLAPEDGLEPLFGMATVSASNAGKGWGWLAREAWRQSPFRRRTVAERVR